MSRIKLNRFKLKLCILFVFLLSICFNADCRRIPYLIDNELLEKAKEVKVLAISGPSGVGKTSLLKEMLQRSDMFILLPRVTTRASRSKETDLKDHRYLTPGEFIQLAQKGEILFTAYHYGYLYGYEKDDIKKAVKEALDKNKIIIVVASRTAVDMKKWLFPDMKIITILPEQMNIVSLSQNGMEESDKKRLKNILETRIKNRTPGIASKELQERIGYMMNDDYIVNLLQESDLVLSNISIHHIGENCKKVLDFFKVFLYR